MGIDTLSGEKTLLNLILPPFLKGVYSKGNGVPESDHEATNVVSKDGISTKCV